MKGSLKAGLVVGFVQVLINGGLVVVGATFCCGICPIPLLSWLPGGAIAGWLAVEFSDGTPERPAWSGAIAGFLSAMGCLLGMVLPVGGIVVLDRIPGFDDLIVVEESPSITGLPSMDTAELLGSTVMIALLIGGIVALLLLFVLITMGAGAAGAKYRSATKVDSEVSNGGAAQQAHAGDAAAPR